MNDRGRLIEREVPQAVEPAPEIEFQILPVGWVCPVCGSGVAPYVTICPCTFQGVTISSNSIIYTGDTSAGEFVSSQIAGVLLAQEIPVFSPGEVGHCQVEFPQITFT